MRSLSKCCNAAMTSTGDGGNTGDKAKVAAPWGRNKERAQTSAHISGTGTSILFTVISPALGLGLKAQNQLPWLFILQFVPRTFAVGTAGGYTKRDVN